MCMDSSTTHIVSHQVPERLDLVYRYKPGGSQWLQATGVHQHQPCEPVCTHHMWICAQTWAPFWPLVPFMGFWMSAVSMPSAPLS